MTIVCCNFPFGWNMPHVVGPTTSPSHMCLAMWCANRPWIGKIIILEGVIRKSLRFEIESPIHFLLKPLHFFKKKKTAETSLNALNSTRQKKQNLAGKRSRSSLPAVTVSKPNSETRFLRLLHYCLNSSLQSKIAIVFFREWRKVL